jgi:hypothetical protein
MPLVPLTNVIVSGVHLNRVHVGTITMAVAVVILLRSGVLLWCGEVTAGCD